MTHLLASALEKDRALGIPFRFISFKNCPDAESAPSADADLLTDLFQGLLGDDAGLLGAGGKDGVDLARVSGELAAVRAEHHEMLGNALGDELFEVAVPDGLGGHD